jgi:basic membrane protein A
MRKGILWTAILVGLFVSLWLAAAMGGTATAANKIRVAIGLDGTNNDQGWYESGYQGAMKLKEDPGVAEVTFQERVKVGDMERAIRRWAVEGYNLILGQGYSWGAPARKVAPEFPNTTFAVAGFFNNKDIPNLVNYLVQAHETGYMAGVLAALMTKSQKIGVIGGFPIPQQIADHNGFILGARSINPKIEVSSIFINDWFDASKAKEAAIAMIDQKVDVLDVTAQPMGFGSYKAAEEKGVMAIGIYVDLRPLAPNTFITSSIWNWHAALKKIVLDMSRGKKLKKHYLVGATDGGVWLGPFNKRVPADVAKRVRTIEKDIQSKKLKVPYLSKKVLK